MLITVAICTWNRSALLRRTLDSLAGVRVPAGLAWEVVVVANRCTDGTADVCREAARTLPARLIEEQRLGLSHARNAAVTAARGRYIAWIDDDVLVGPGWLEAYADAIADRPQAAFFGGPIRPWFENEPPAWLAEALPIVGNAFSLLDYGPEPIDFHANRLPFGANFVIRADVQRKHRYDPHLGRRGPALRSGEETAVLHAVLADGGVGIWVPRAELRHFVSAERQSRRYLRRYFFNNGVAASIVGYPPTERAFLGRPLWIWREAVENELRYLLTRPFASPAVWGGHLRMATTAWGQLYGMSAARARRDPPGPPPPG